MDQKLLPQRVLSVWFVRLPYIPLERDADAAPFFCDLNYESLFLKTVKGTLTFRHW